MTFADKVKLQLVRFQETVVIGRTGPRSVKAERLTSLFKLPSRGTWYDGLVDTGSFLTILPESVWTRHLKDIDWATPSDGDNVPDWMSKISGLTGGEFACRVGIIPFTFCDVFQRQLQPRPLLVKCAQDGGRIKRSLIGLGGGAFEGLRLEVEYTVNNAWLHEVNVD